MKKLGRFFLAAGAGAAATAAALKARVRPAPGSSNVDLIKARYEAVNAHDWDRFAGFYSDSIVWDDPGLAEAVRGPAAVRSRLETLAQAFPDLRWNLDRIFTQGDLVCAEFTFTGTQREPLPTRDPGKALDPTGQAVRLRAVGVYQVTGGKIADSRIYFDFGRLASP